MTPALLQAIIRHAAECYPRECCGLVVSKGGGDFYMPCKNQAEHGEHFILSAEDYVTAENLGSVAAVVHSHPDCTAGPSDRDMQACGASGHDWIIVSYPEVRWWKLRPVAMLDALSSMALPTAIH